MAKSEKTIGSFNALYFALFTATRIIRKISTARLEKIARCTTNVISKKTAVTNADCIKSVFEFNLGRFGFSHRSGRNDKMTVSKSTNKKDNRGDIIIVSLHKRRSA